MPHYSTHDPKGWGGDPARGAALGRATILNIPKEKAVRFTLQRIRLNGGGYDRYGTYFGSGAPVYWYAATIGADEVDAVIRADSREHAKRIIRAQYPKAKFYR